MRAFAPDVGDLVTRAVQLALIGSAIGIVECGEHLLIRQKPTAELVVDVVRTVLQKDANRFGWSTTDERGIQIAARSHRLAVARRAIADRCVAADATDHVAKPSRPFPRDGDGAIRPAARAANRSGFRVFGEIIGLADLGQHFIDEETRVTVTERVVFGGAIVRVAAADLDILVTTRAGRDEDA